MLSQNNLRLNLVAKRQYPYLYLVINCNVYYTRQFASGSTASVMY